MTTMFLQRRAVLAMAVSAGLAVATGAQANAGLVDLTVVDRATGQPLQVWRHRGRLFVAGQPGARYSLRVANNTGGRVLVVMSVDGVNILTGETAGYDQRGYVFDPYESYDISGWRKSDHEVAQFSFASQSRSYAARTGRPHDVGVIGMAVFKERVDYAPLPPPRVAPMDEPEARRRPESSSADIQEMVVTGRRVAPSAPPAIVQRREERLGTAHGAREWSTVTQVAFVRATQQPAFVRRIEYDTHRNLVAAGVIPPPHEPGRRPRPFPASGYVPDPPAGS